ncbi:MAG TPA: NUDIX hydrolase [Candidatus Poseidoniales archaeon]|nr:MAG: DNA mismatch repair protein MutT [Euryarchaeota archaeon]HHZ74653.1 NUDIX hydrolase [Candidatus Poseidoniales archaeon]PXY75742.1 MAG: DNA mismatch repair protein MutT [Euryarchaeota archaeon]PXY79428.1 MAG: DNA mismatch repair protein MutT [Euryarchaeota archaeon]HIA25485.1 NUDIX hydrolase [Candidatus Poseidoniales archaeon]
MNDGPCPTCGTYHNPALTVDAVAVRGSGEESEVLLIRRGQEPWKGCWAFPGGFVDVGESPEDAVARELFEECNIVGKASEIIAVRGEPERDPRGHVVSIFYRVEVDRNSGEPLAGDDAAEAEWVKLSQVDLEKMGADHAEIIQLL